MGGACGTYGGDTYRVLVGSPDGKKSTGSYRRIMLKGIFKKWEGHGLDWSGSGWGEAASCCECENEHSGWIECGILITSLGIICCQEEFCSIELVRDLFGWLVVWFVTSSLFGPNNLHSPTSSGLYKMSAAHLTVISTQINRSTRRHFPEHSGLTLKSGFSSSPNLRVTTTQKGRYVAVCVSVILFVFLTLFACLWSYLNGCDLICVSVILFACLLSYLRVCDLICVSVILFVCLWSYLRVCDLICVSVILFAYLWSYLRVCDLICVSVIFFACLWSDLCLWSYLCVCDIIHVSVILFVCLWSYLRICDLICMSVILFVCLWSDLCLWSYLCVCELIYVSAILFVCLWSYLCVCDLICVSAILFMCLWSYLCVCDLIHVSVILFVCLWSYMCVCELICMYVILFACLWSYLCLWSYMCVWAYLYICDLICVSMIVFVSVILFVCLWSYFCVWSNLCVCDRICVSVILFVCLWPCSCVCDLICLSRCAQVRHTGLPSQWLYVLLLTAERWAAALNQLQQRTFAEFNIIFISSCLHCQLLKVLPNIWPLLHFRRMYWLSQHRRFVVSLVQATRKNFGRR